jgi:hypothetical protein
MSETSEGPHPSIFSVVYGGVDRVGYVFVSGGPKSEMVAVQVTDENDVPVDELSQDEALALFYALGQTLGLTFEKREETV